MWKHKISFVGRREESNKESRGFKLGREIKKGVGINDFGIWRAWGRSFWNF